ncbi:hypothetical protein BGW36DRAFT_108100 [Talaromyces proteolyticus]|uniref:Shikimate dehydrogenase substrate binding N-terminal domain-containing protein n=1 Tax=Talaromyces proteolyticus TaxID=1131652 RepID=A0AAD4Q147_9EURO|nr:uncharacterized protein BGW36DRAFT_108100 [Talaromyces proteolyticus]KAH8701899.1 hypothetical protein BGW36DRAFT_108100 [Talaromyces proteolyticus]
MRKTTRKTLFLFGQPIEHSVSPVFHNTLFKSLKLPWRYIRLDSQDAEDLAWFMRNADFVGAAVTMPNKTRVIPYLDTLTEDARRIGCVNTIYTREVTSNREGGHSLVGTNTDWLGIKNALWSHDPGLVHLLQERPAVVIGGGATSRSAIYALTEGFGVKEVFLVNRDAEEVEVMIKDLKKRGMREALTHLETMEDVSKRLHVCPAVIISAVPDMGPQTPLEQLARKIALTLIQMQDTDSGITPGALLEMAYTPSPWTQLAKAASAAGWKIITGIDVMELQAIEQAALWTGVNIETLPYEEARNAMRSAILARGKCKI